MAQKRKKRLPKSHLIPFDLPDEWADAFGFHEEPGWAGSFTRMNAAKAKHLAGERVVKIIHEKGDLTKPNTYGTVLGSFQAPGPLPIGYFIEWDTLKRVAAFIMEHRIGPGLLRPHGIER